jgi:UDP-glucose 6-dehydrogenase
LEKRGLTEQLAQASVSDATDVYFGDEMRVGLIGQVRRVWAPRGVKVEQKVEYQYEWAYLNLAVNGLVGQLTWDWTDDMKAASIAPVVKSWAEDGVQVIVWDRARGHRGDAYQDVSVQRIEQPPYSPQLNPGERIFEYVRDRIEGQVYGTIVAKKEAVEKELRQLAKDPQKIKQLAGWEWIRESVDQLSAQNMALS